MQIIYKTIDSIIPYEFNNRAHTDEQINRIANSINEFGFNQPLVIDEKNIILVGHGCYLAAQKLGLKEVPCYLIKGLSETKKKAYRILDNKLQNDSSWDFEKLELEFAALEADGFELEPWGLDELKNLFGESLDTDPEKEWQGMPEFISEDKTALQSITVHFMTREHVQEFAKLVDQLITENTKYIWFPKQLAKDLKSLRIAGVTIEP